MNLLFFSFFGGKSEEHYSKVVKTEANLQLLKDMYIEFSKLTAACLLY